VSDVGPLSPSPRLRWYRRGAGEAVLQQYFTVDVPAYMRSNTTPGEWRDVPVVEDLAP
jgi:hypothetical protein